MLKQRIVLCAAALVLCLHALPALAQEDEEDRLLFSSRDDAGVTTEFRVSDAALKASPPWRPAEGDPPLALGKAIEIATQAVRAQHPKFDDVQVWDVHIMSAQCGEGASRWFYSIGFSPVIDGRRMYGGNVEAVLLMNGTVVEARVKKGKAS